MITTFLDAFLTEFLRVANGLAVLLAAVAAWIAARSTRVAVQANKISGKALRTQYVPWVNIDRAEISNDHVEDDQFLFQVQVLLKNHGTTPALNLFAEFDVSDQNVPPALCDTKQVCLMPGECGTVGRQFQLPIRRGEQLHGGLLTGDKHLTMVLTFTDALGNPYTVRDQIRFQSKDSFSPINYNIDGLPE